MRDRTIRLTRALLTLCALPCLLQCEGAPSCTELNDGAGEQTKALLDNMDRSCTTDSDCVIQ
ncbi:MAG TPA: hypothetical protein VG963_03665, partial [Polyangiaceae bacterium]|nr:hypothetical protein [Polyangiaceae bacterium]